MASPPEDLPTHTDVGSAGRLTNAHDRYVEHLLAAVSEDLGGLA